MKKAIFILFCVLTQYAGAQSIWKVDRGHSSINFSVSHFLISDVTGNFQEFDIAATANDQLENPTVNVTIQTASINTNNSKRDDHLRADDFFYAEKYEQITFKSTKYEGLEDGTFQLTGDLFIKGITKEVMFTGKVRGIIKDRNGKNKAGLKLTATIPREEFKVGLGMDSIGEEVTVEINIEMSQQ